MLGEEGAIKFKKKYLVFCGRRQRHGLQKKGKKTQNQLKENYGEKSDWKI